MQHLKCRWVFMFGVHELDVTLLSAGKPFLSNISMKMQNKNIFRSFKDYEPQVAYMQNIWVSVIRYAFLRFPQTILLNDSLKSLHAYDDLGLCTITCLNTCWVRLQVPPWKFILLQHYVGWIKMKTNSPTNFPVHRTTNFSQLLKTNLFPETTFAQTQTVFIWANSAILTVE